MLSKLGAVEIGSRGEITVTPQSLPLSANLTPIAALRGEVTCQDNKGNLVTETAPHLRPPADPAAALRFKFTSSLLQLDLKTAWNAARQLNGRAYWYALSYKAMELMDVRLASRVYRELGDAGMVMGLERLLDVEDVKLLAGHMALLYDDYAKAQDLFLSSSRPRSALEMRMDLLHWNEALKLAQTLSPSEVPEISVEYARQLEFKGEFSAALKMFEQALALLQDPSANIMRGEALLSLSVGGVARCTLRCGDLRRGLRIVGEANDTTLCLECARILESMESVADTEAATLYEKGLQFDKAAAIYVKSAKNLPAASAIIDKVHTPKLLGEYAARCEKEGMFEEAAKAYERANDSDSVVRLCLSNLNKPERAFDIVRSTSSSTGARLVAHYCKHEGNFRGAIEFLLLAACTEEAFQLAKVHECMDVFTKSLGDGIDSTQAASVAAYYEGLNQLGNAGHFYSLCGQSVKLLL
jgi:WD repeat-containing protein 19